MVVVVAMVELVVTTVVGALVGAGSGTDVVVGSAARPEHPANTVIVTTRRARRISATLTPAEANQEVA
jgi:hypothetical protein